MLPEQAGVYRPIPKFPSFLAFAIVLIVTTAGIFFYKKKRVPTLTVMSK
jgi:LPXTG-motif cell wall-anchored protein